MKELSLFTGAGGGLLGTELLGWTSIGYVESNNYCQKILKQRIKDGVLDEAPIFSDIRTFNSEGYARVYSGLVDVITAGFPCQPFSVAGKQQGADDERNMWPETIRTIGIVKPKYCLLENVPNLLRDYFGRVLSDLAKAGYDAKWRVLGADDVGANHRRKRLWIIASNPDKFDGNNGGLCPGKISQQQTSDISGCKKDVSVSGSKWEIKRRNARFQPITKTERQQTNHRSGEKKHVGREWWSAEPDVGRVVNGVASRVDRLKAIGNGQVPAVVKAVWELLTQNE